jgi:hypothetical protein
MRQKKVFYYLRSDGANCDNPYTSGYGLVPVILLMVYIFFFNLVIY